MNKAIIIQSCTESWEGLFVNGKLVEEGHTLNEGYNRVKYILGLSKEYDFNVEELQYGTVTDEYDEELCDRGSFHNSLNDIGYYQ